jgi:hypothetical protein
MLAPEFQLTVVKYYSNSLIPGNLLYGLRLIEVNVNV